MSMGPEAGRKQIMRKIFDKAISESYEGLPVAKTLQDYKNLKEIINSLVGVKSTNITKFDKESIFYDIEVYGNLLNFVYEISDSSYINIDSFDTSKSEIVMSLES